MSHRTHSRNHGREVKNQGGGIANLIRQNQARLREIEAADNERRMGERFNPAVAEDQSDRPAA